MADQIFTVGILGTANIARKNIVAMKAATHVTCTTVGSRNLERAQTYASENNVPNAKGSYQEVLDDPTIHGVYLPLPTTTHLEWVIKAAQAGKHIVCEKPIGINTAELLEMFKAIKSANVGFMDGVMFNHHSRLPKLTTAFAKLGKSGARQINSQFSFKGGADFFRNNIRVSATGDPLGCLGDLGWYNVRFSLFAFNYELPKTVQCTVQSSSIDDVPYQAVGTMTWSEEKETDSDNVPIAPRSSTFVCSFLATECQNCTVVGEDSYIEMDDFVIPKDPKATSFNVVKQNWGAKAQNIQVDCDTVVCEGDQTVLMWEAFREISLNEDGRRSFFIDVALKTQLIIDALMESSRQGGAVVVVPELPVV